MAQSPDPWGRPAESASRPGRYRWLIWIALALAVTAGLMELSRLFPGAVSTADEPYLVYLIGVLVLVSASFAFGRQIKFSEAMRNIAIWLAIAAVLVFGFVFRDEFSAIGARVRSEFLPGDAVVTGNHTLTLTQDENGDFYIYGEANGTRLRFLVDTGATDIVLSPSDARRLGIDVASLHFVQGYETANGIGAGASTTLDRLSVGPIQLWNVPVSINRTDMRASLLGTAFLKQMKSFEFRGRKLYIRW